MFVKKACDVLNLGASFVDLRNILCDNMTILCYRNM